MYFPTLIVRETNRYGQQYIVSIHGLKGKPIVEEDMKKVPGPCDIHGYSEHAKHATILEHHMATNYEP